MSMLEAALVPPTILHREDGGSWFITGPAGSGKSWVLSQIAAGLPQRRVHWLRCAALGAGPVDLATCVDPPVDAGTVTDLAGALAGSVVLVDDVNALEDAALSDLAALAVRTPHDEIVLVFTERSGSARPATAAVAARCSPVTLAALDPLRPTFRQVAGEVDDDEADRLLRSTGGWYELVAAAADGAEDVTELMRPRYDVLTSQARRLATVLAFGASLQDGSAERLLGDRGEALDGLVAELEASGVLHMGSMAPAVAAALRDLTPVGRRRDELDAFLDADVAGAIDHLAGWLLGTADRSPEALRVMVRAARDRPADEAEPLLAAAARSSGNPDVSAQWIGSLLRTGQARAALAEAVGAGVDGAILRASLARVGRLADAAKLDDPDDLHSAIAAASVGLVDEAEQVLSSVDADVVGPRATAFALASAAVALVRGDDMAVRLVRDAQRLAGDGVDTDAWPVDPTICASIVGTVAHASAPPVKVGSERRGGFAALAQVVSAWQAMRSGRLQDARLDDMSALEPLEAALSAVVDAGVALRSDHLDALGGKVTDALAAMDDVQMDAWRLPIAAELLAPAARSGIAAGMIGESCRPLLEACAPSSILRLSFAWAELLAAIAADDEASVSRSVAVFGELSGSTPAHELFASVVPVVADVFDGQVEPDAVLAASAALRDAGLVYDAGRLTGAAAMRCTDERQAKALLRESRAMRQERKASARAGGDVTELSEREVEVARLVVQGRTHKEVGATLFISAKTVEHHVARIRNKLGASSRAEMMAAIRDYLDANDNLDG